MNDLIKILQESDILSLAVEQSRQNFEAAKNTLEKAKVQLEEAQDNLGALLAKSEEVGISRSKLKKLIDERTQALLSSGLWLEGEGVISKTPKAPRKKMEKSVPEFTPETEMAEASA